MNKIRTRFAPSPTGSLHIGGLRTALFNWMFARRFGGDFILRIEDTDQKRYDENALKVLLESLQWAGLNYDEFYVQSERLDLYTAWAHHLVNQGHAYYCTCSSERLKQVSEQRVAQGHNPGYDGYCRPDLEGQNKHPLTLEEAQASLHGYVVRLLMPRHGYVEYDDLIRGHMKFKNNVYNDPILLKSDGFPTYHLAHVIDDHDMEISHVIRAQEWLPSTPIHLTLWDAFGWQRPEYAHLPVLLNPTGKGKISKRNPPKDDQGNVIPVLVHDYINGGYLPEAVLNFLCNTGWNYGRSNDAVGAEIEIYSMDEAIQRFDLGDVVAANSRFPTAKLKHINAHYIRNMYSNEFVKALATNLPEGIDVLNHWQLIEKIAPLIQPRIKTLLEGVELARPFFERPNGNQHFYLDFEQRSTIEDMLQRFKNEEVFDWSVDWNADAIRGILEDYAGRFDLKLRDVCAPIRYALTGQTVSVPLFEMMEILGREECLTRIEAVLG